MAKDDKANNSIDNPVREEKGFKILGFPWELAFLLFCLFAGVLLVVLKLIGVF